MKKLMSIFTLFVLIGTLTACNQDENTIDAELEEITVVLDWTPNTNHTGLYVALEEGYYKEQGLNVEIIQPTAGSSDQLVANGTAHFGVSYQESVTYSRAADTPIVSIAAIIQHNTSGFAALKEAGIESPKDFVGKTYGGWGTAVEKAMIRALMEADGVLFTEGETIDDKVNIVQVGAYNFFAPGDIDFFWEYEAWTLKKAELEGVDYTYIDLAEENDIFDYYTPVLITSEDMIENNNETVQKFMDATKMGYEYAIENPTEAAEDLLTHAPELDRDLVIRSQEFLADEYQSDASVWGIQKENVWSRYTNWLVELGEIEQSIDVSKAYTNDYIE
ncbi:ABC transporter substrate-binding protein [Haloplasma contractile]|uniref:NMT1-THI5-like domain-containing protein n=1 Tax=Haloplasma contractile SSD-17B TaxID=1033810 RepID=U2EDJ0_9MOLU|nr:ABC transporter substrate-binding protein [Haloplasma contractile]ERJ13048.1 NMT1-THI5-like domain-containing protein [Haloplasma contractile SSD-17B]